MTPEQPTRDIFDWFALALIAVFLLTRLIQRPALTLSALAVGGVIIYAFWRREK